ncbi:NAD-P-binding protein [Trametes cingulata]|nr:NAD-P-binding protein [Trametes cingulata]
MPTLSPPAKVLVTGANGYVGCWVVRALLDKGYSVRAAVRTQKKADTLSALIAAKHPSAASAFECAVVADITLEEALDELMDGVQGVVHTATPVTFSLEDPEDYIRPAVVGTLNIVRGAAKHGVKRVVITSSVGAIAESFTEETRVYTEEDWNEHAVDTVRKLGKEATGYLKYGASKVLAEQAAWEYYKDNKDNLPYELSVVAPAWILGPIPDDPPSPAAFATPSPILEWEQLFMVPPPEKPHPAVFNYVDIRDVTEMHLRALERPEAAGERFISNSLVCTWQDWFNAAHELNVLPGLPKLHPPAPVDREHLPPHPIFSNEKAQRLLGIGFKTIPETLKDLVEDFRGRGWLKHLES